MKIYIRKLLAHDISHEVSVTTSIVNDFFDGQTSFLMTGKNSNQSGTVTINSATDPRFGGDFKNLLRYEGDVSEGDIVVIYKYQNHYTVDVVNKNDEKYNTLLNVTSEDKRHTILLSESNETILEESKDIEEDNQSELEKFRKYYKENLHVLKNDIELYDGIRLRKEFQEEYPLDKLKDMTLEEYALGDPNTSSDSLSYKLEFGVYFKSGLPVTGYSSGKHGIYKNKNGVYCNYLNKPIENPKEYWEEFRNQLYSFLLEVGQNDEFPNVKEKYPLIKNIPGLATKLCYLYYPKKFINIGKRDVLVNLIDKFSIDIDDTYSPKLSFELSKYLRTNISEVNDDDPQWIGSVLWLYKDYTSEEKHEEKKNKIDTYSPEQFKKDVFISDSKYEDIISLLKRKKNIILTGAPGVGKTFMAKKLVYSLQENTDKSRMLCIQFHQSYSYEEFIEGYRPLEDGGFKLEEGLFYKFCKECENDSENKPYYLIIDEINRGNLSKIFGELLMLIEADKRGDKLQLAYSKKEFSVPNNLYIIGLMNTADRSLALMDYALRRRFSFINIEPAYGTTKFKNAFEKMFDNTYDEAMKLIEDINDAIKNDLSLGEGFMIGHSYFCIDTENGSKGTEEDIKNILKYEIKPLIEEYWYDEKETKDKWVSKIKEYIER